MRFLFLRLAILAVCRSLGDAVELVDTSADKVADNNVAISKLKAEYYNNKDDDTDHSDANHQLSSSSHLRSKSALGDGGGSNYVFLQKFPLANTDDLLFHTEILVCPRSNFPTEDQTFLDGKINSLKDFVEIEESWWSPKSDVTCLEMGYGGNACTKKCCGSPYYADQQNFALNERRAVIYNAKVSEKSLYLYGAGEYTGEQAREAMCGSDEDKCWSNWAGIDYNPITNNCNTFTSTVLSCVYGLSEKKPHLGPSDFINVKCKNECHPKTNNLEAS